MHIGPQMAVHSSKERACRDVTTERKPYPSFAPEDFPAAYEASQKALQLASLAQARAPESQARHFCHLLWHLNGQVELTSIHGAHGGYQQYVACLTALIFRNPARKALGGLAQSRALGQSRARQSVPGQGCLAVHLAALYEFRLHRHTAPHPPVGLRMLLSFMFSVTEPELASLASTVRATFHTCSSAADWLLLPAKSACEWEIVV